MSESNEEMQITPLIGTIIRNAREKKNVSVKIVSQHTKISSTNLEALEANDFSKLPNQAYVRGYVKSCSKLLGLNENECLTILEANYDALEKPQRVLQKIEEKKEQESKENNQLIIKMLGVVSVVVIFVALITSNDGNDNTAKNLKKDVSVAEEEKIEEAKDETITPEVLSKTTPLKAEETPVVIATPVPTPEPTPEATPTPKVVEKKKDGEEKKKEIELRQINGKLYGFDSKASSDELEEWLPSNFKAPVVDGKQNVFIHAINGDTWLTYQVDGGEIKKFVLKKDQKLFVTGEEVLFFLGNYNVAKIFLNNKLLDITSRSGVKSLVFPQEKASEHYYPLFIYKDDGSVVNSKTYKSQL